MAKEINICSAVDRNFISLVPTLFNSIIMNTPQEINFYLFAKNLLTLDKKKLKKNVPKRINLKIIDTTKLLPAITFKLYEHITPSTMDRIFITSLLPKVDKVIYLDTDLVVNADLEELYSMPTSKKGISAREDWCKNYKTLKEYIVKVNGASALKRIPKGAPINKKYFNAGVLVLDLKKLRQNKFEEKTKKLLKWGFDDQILINIYAKSNYYKLDHSWNIFANKEDSQNGKIIHWAGDKKPWKDKNIKLKNYWNRYYVSSTLPATINQTYSLLNKMEYERTKLEERIKRKIRNSYHKNMGKMGLLMKNNLHYMYYPLKKIKDEMEKKVSISSQ